ncbi:MAG: CDP-alcohol phosphatidyltransferase family protein [Candidatus Calescibacterium sp.]|nr:CDP-alcohol phosphatidyltransferase family protein [Candidatus Calescibacterium sp.]MCX7734629.1 CDP-alcohol phosphatidyltransferase family protein [bacterium]MDW8087021.1 CDP-alcohol phosphatidyltransferase family protein [Candidatus Calescibacterium sp.]
MLERINFYVSSALLGVIAFSLIIYSFSFQKTEIEKYEEERIRKYASGYPRTIKKIYKFLGEWIIWIASKVFDAFPKNIDPIKISISGMILSIGAAVSISLNFVSLGSILVLLGGFMDILDGKSARTNNRVSPSGAFIDSVLDRIGEIAIFSSISIMYIQNNYQIPASITVLALGFSILVSYIRSRGESLGILSEEGIMRRQERIFLIFTGLLLDSLFYLLTKKIIFITISVTLILIGSLYTSIERFRFIYLKLKSKK